MAFPVQPLFVSPGARLPDVEMSVNLHFKAAFLYKVFWGRSRDQTRNASEIPASSHNGLVRKYFSNILVCLLLAGVAYGQAEGEKLGADLKKWDQAIKAGQVQAAIEKALLAATQGGELTESQKASVKAVLRATTTIKDGDRSFLAQRVVVPGVQGKPPVVDTYMYVELKDGETADSAAQRLVSSVLSNNYILLRLGVGAAAREIDRVIQDSDQAIRLNPKDAEAFNNRGLAYYKKREIDRAIQDYDEAIRLNPTLVEAFYNRGRAYQYRGKYKEAIQDYNRALQLNPGVTQVLYQRGEAYFLQGDHDLAIRDFSEVLRVNPVNYTAIYRLGQSHYAKAAYDQAIEDFSHTLWLNPNDRSALSHRGGAYAHKRDYVRAIKDFDQIIQLNPKDAWAFRYRGDAYYDKGEHDRAIQDYDQALGLDPKNIMGGNPQVLNKRGLAYAAKGEYDRAIQDYDEASRLKPNDSWAFNLRGLAYNKKGEYDRPIQDFDQAIKLSPNYAVAFHNRGDAYYDKGAYDRAIQDYDQAIRLNSNDAHSFAMRGIAYARREEYDRAIQDYDQAIRLNSNDAWALRNRAYARFYQGRFATAVPDLAKAVQLEPADLYGAIWLFLARTRAGQSGRDELKSKTTKNDMRAWPGPVVSLYLGTVTPQAVLDAAVDQEPQKQREKLCEAYFYVGQHHLIRGRRDEAIRMFRAAIDTGVTTCIPYVGAKAELKRMGH